jgi:hypothetical protein
MRAYRILAIALAAASFAQGVSAQSKSLVGTWKLVSASSTTENGRVNNSVFGDNPTGFITYTADGRMTVIISDGGRKPLSVSDRIAAATEEKAKAFSTFVAYAGRYTFTGDKVVHHVEAASIQNWVNTDLVRSASLEGDRLVLKTPPTARGGVQQRIELIWQKLNSNK